MDVTFKLYTHFTFIPLFCYAVFLVSCETLNKCLNFEDVMIHQKARHTTANWYNYIHHGIMCASLCSHSSVSSALSFRRHVSSYRGCTLTAWYMRYATYSSELVCSENLTSGSSCYLMRDTLRVCRDSWCLVYSTLVGAPTIPLFCCLSATVDW